MSTSIVFEVRSDEPALQALITPVAALSEYDPVRMRIEGSLMVWWGTRVLERVAVAEARGAESDVRSARARATRAANKATS